MPRDADPVCPLCKRRHVAKIACRRDDLPGRMSTPVHPAAVDMSTPVHRACPQCAALQAEVATLKTQLADALAAAPSTNAKPKAGKDWAAIKRRQRERQRQTKDAT